MNVSMPRKAATFRMDDRVIDGLKKISDRSGLSKTRWLELHLLNLLKETGVLPPDTVPLPEKRGTYKRNKNTAKEKSKDD